MPPSWVPERETETARTQAWEPERVSVLLPLELERCSGAGAFTASLPSVQRHRPSFARTPRLRWFSMSEAQPPGSEINLKCPVPGGPGFSEAEKP